MHAGTGIITKTELKCFYTAFLDVGKLGEQKILEITDSAFEALTSVRTSVYAHACSLYWTLQVVFVHWTLDRELLEVGLTR